MFPHVFLLSYVPLVLLWLLQKKRFLCHNYNWIHFISIHVDFITYDFYMWMFHITMCIAQCDWINNIFSLGVRTSFSSTIPHFLWFQWQSIICQFTGGWRTLFCSCCGTQACPLGIVTIFFWVLQLLLLIIQIGRLSLRLINLSKS